MRSAIILQRKDKHSRPFFHCFIFWYSNTLHCYYYLHVAVFTPSQGFFNFLVYIRPRVIKYFQQRKKLKNRRPSCSNRDDSLSSNILHVSGISCGSSSEVQGADASSKSDEKFDLKLTDPFMSTTPGNTDAETTEPSTVKTALDSCVSIIDSITTSWSVTVTE